MTDFDPNAPAAPPSEEANPFLKRWEQRQAAGETLDDSVSLWDRFKANAYESAVGGTLAGSGEQAENFRRMTDPNSSPEGRDLAANSYHMLARERAKYAAMQGWDTPLEGMAALGGQLAGGMTSPEAVIDRGFGSLLGPVERAVGPVFSRILDAALTQGVVNPVTDLATQGDQIARGERDKIDVSQLGMSALLGVGIGGTLGGAGEAARALSPRPASPLPRMAERPSGEPGAAGAVDFFDTIKRVDEERFAASKEDPSLVGDADAERASSFFQTVREADARLTQEGQPAQPRVLVQDPAEADAVKRQWRAETPYLDRNEMLKAAPENQRQLGEAGTQIAEEVGSEFKDPGVKALHPDEIAAIADEELRAKKQEGLDRFNEKASERANPGEVTDLVRSGFLLNNPAQADATISKMAERFDVVDEGWVVTDAGYFDRKAYVRFKDGMIGEVQLWEPTLLHAKEKEGGHDLYKKWRSLPPDSAEAADLAQQMRDLYQSKLQALSPEWRAIILKGSGSEGSSGNLALKASSESDRASMDGAAPLMSDQAPSLSTQAPPLSKMTGSPSQEPNLKAIAGATSTGNVTAPAAASKAISESQAGNSLLGKPVAKIQKHTVTTSSGRRIEVAPVVVEARDLKASSDAGYDAGLQPRNRDRAASQAQIRDIASNLEPERLGYSAEADRGAPIVGGDGMVESGNGRVLAIRRAYEQGGEAAQRYRAWLEQQGVDVAGYDEPVLVRQNMTPLSGEERKAFTVEANQAATLSMSAAERAMADARVISPDMLSLIRNPDDLGAIANRDFIRAFVQSLPQTEQGGMVTAEGGLSSEGLTRVRNAVLARAYGDSAVLTRIAEATSDEVKSISNALISAAPDWAKLRADVDAGVVREDMDWTPELLEAVSRTADLRGKGMKLDTFLAQQDAFDKISDPVEGFMRFFYNPTGRRAAGAEVIGDRLKFFATEARKVSADDGLGLDLPPVRPEDIQALARNRGTDNVKSAASQDVLFRRGAGDGASGGKVGAEAQGRSAGAGSEGPGGARGVGDQGGAGDIALRKRQTQPQTGTAGGGAGGQGQVAAAAAGKSAPSPEVISLQDQAISLADKIGFPLRQGRVQGGKAALGQFDTRQGVSRVKAIADFETVAHEAGHALEQKIGAPLSGLIQTHAPELGPLDYDQTRLSPHEGFAEFLRMYLTAPAAAQQAAPRYAAAFRLFLEANAPDMMRALDEAQASYQAFANAPAGERVDAIVKRDEPVGVIETLRKEGLAKSVGLVMSRIYDGLFDDKSAVTQSVRDLARMAYEASGQRMSLEGTANPELLVRMFSRAQQAAVGDMKYGVRGYRQVTPSGPSLSSAIARATGGASILGNWNDAKVKDFSNYLVLRRAQALWEKYDLGQLDRRPLSLSKADVLQGIADAEAANPNLRDAANMVHDYTRGLLQKMYDGGLIEKDLFDTLQKETFYVPFYRVMTDKPQTSSVPTSGASQGPGTAQLIKRMRGSDRDIVDPLQSIMTQTFLVNRTIAHNDAIKSFVSLARAAQKAGATDTGRIVEEIPAHQIVGQKFDLAESVKAAASQNGISPQDTQVLLGAVANVFGPDPIMGSVFMKEPARPNGEPIVFYKEGGKLKAVRFISKDEGLGLYEALTELPPVARDWAVVAGQAGATMMRAGIVTSPTFAVTNFIRDQIAATILRPDYIPFNPRGTASEITQNHWAQLYSYSGGMSPGAAAQGLDGMINRSIDELARKGWRAQKVGALSDLMKGDLLGPAKAVAEVIETAETGTRLNVFKQVFEQKKRQGLSDYDAMMEAGYQATDLMDFSRHGSGTLLIRTLVPFLNAQLQGLDKAWRTLGTPILRAMRGDILTKQDEAALKNAGLAWFKMAGVGGALGYMYGLWASQHDAYKDANEQLRATHFVIPGGPFGYTGKILVIPKPFELAIGFNLGELAAQAVATGDPRVKDFALAGIQEVVLPPNVMNSIPVLKLSAELALNRSFFTGRDIVPERLQALQPAEQYTEKTSNLARTVGSAIGVSPVKVDYAIGSAFGLWGRDLLALSNTADPRAPAASTYDQMFLRRFIKNADSASETTKRFWDLSGERNGELAQAKNTYETMLQQFRDQDASDFLAKQPTSTRAFVTLNSAADENGKAAFNSDEKRLHPVTRAAEAARAINGYIRELQQDAQVSYDSGERQKMDPDKRRQVIETLRVMQAMEQQNALTIMKEPGYEKRPLLSVEDQFNVLMSVSPDAGAEVATRYATAKIAPTAAVARVWPDAQKRLLNDGSMAELRDLAMDVKSEGYAFGGERVKRPAKRRVVIPSIPEAAAPPIQ